jgi:hypothetical protein
MESMVESLCSEFAGFRVFGDIAHCPSYKEDGDVPVLQRFVVSL